MHLPGAMEILLGKVIGRVGMARALMAIHCRRTHTWVQVAYDTSQSDAGVEMGIPRQLDLQCSW